uniref:Uncharacterized protein n=1 Tax=Arundo donax TaxID=35708 RepID=A0A0A9H2B7_ARUDO
MIVVSVLASSGGFFGRGQSAFKSIL